MAANQPTLRREFRAVRQVADRADEGMAAALRHDVRRTAADIAALALYITLARHVRAFGVELRTIPVKVVRRQKAGEAHDGTTMTERSSEGLDVRRRRLLFRAWRRGVRETDLIVGRFADAYIDKFDDGALDNFERLIEAPNASLYAWVVGSEAVPHDFDTDVLRQLIAFHRRAETGPVETGPVETGPPEPGPLESGR
jgi:antitoxin CptB